MLEKNYNIVVDIEGSDLGSVELSEACVQFLNDNKDVNLVLVGQIDNYKHLFNLYTNRVSFVYANDIVPMEVSPLQLLRMKESSMVKGLRYCQENDLDAFITAGSSGGFITGASLIIKKIPSIQRAAFCAPFITKIKNKQTVILDIGANNENTSDDLVCFAKLGRLYAKNVLSIANPSTYLLSNGAEEGKGLPSVVEAYHKLEEMKFPNFKGNCEAREALDGEHDVIVTNGFSGNIFLKSVEGVAKMMNDMIKKSFKHSFITKIGYLFAKKGFKEMKDTMDYKKTGGAILLGVNKVCVKAHGNSDRTSFYYALNVCLSMCKKDIVNKIKEDLNEGR